MILSISNLNHLMSDMDTSDALAVAGGTGRRVGNACVPCRSSKVRCDGKLPTCQRCLNRKKTCYYGERKGRGRGKSKQYIQTLEGRLKNVEVALQASPAVSLSVSPGSVDPGHSDETSDTHETTAADQIQSLPLTWPEEITSNIIQDQNNKTSPERKVFTPLPPKEYILHFIPHALEGMYEAQPLFATDHVLKLFNDQYSAGSSNCHANPTRWATLNALLASGIRWKADNTAIKELYPLSWAHFKNAFAIFPEIVMHGGGIESCQALVAMALFMRGTADALAFTALLSAAAHAGHTVGLHLEDIPGSNNVIDIERRKRLFWTIYVLRCNASLNFGLPAPPEEVDVSLPSQALATDTGSSTDLLRHMSSLAQVQSRIVRCSRPGLLLSKNCDKIIQDLVKLDTDLESWRTGLPIGVQPTALGQFDDLSITQLHFAYYASTWKLYTAIGKLYSVPLTLVEREQPNFHLSTLLPTHSARGTISLLQGLYSQPLASLWQMICYPMCAALILLIAVLNGPGDSEVPLNVESIKTFLMFLQTFQDREQCDLNGLFEFCSKLYNVASFAQRNSTDLSSQSEDDTEGVWDMYADLRIRLSGSQDPMLLAQGLLSNMQLLGSKAAQVFSGLLVENREDGFTRLVPNVLKPSSLNFFAKQ